MVPRPHNGALIRGGSAPSLLRLGDGPHLAHSSQEVVLGPLLYHLAALIKAVDLDARHLYAVARASCPKELTLVGSCGRVAGYHLITFGYLVLYGVSEVGDGVAEVLDLALNSLRSPDLSGLTVWVVADEV